MKSQLIILCVCLGMLGSTLACAGDEESTTVTDEGASAQSAGDNGQDSAAKPAKSKDRPSGKRKATKAAETKVGENVDRAKMTNADCFPKSVPDSAPTNAKVCVALANSKPDMLFPKHDYDGMPDECKPLVPEKCR